jgi:alkanesulfonate monooxygenase SsuD/methylene tetrahydromethanopterin reductase-like flavin-dependent oxidoreductase (luciferase family)
MGVRIGTGVGRFVFDDVSAFREWIDLCEGSAIDSVWQSDRILSNEPFHEPLSLLAVVAGATRRLKIGMNAVVLGFRDPVTFARQCASIDHLSEGRLLPVIGVGNGGLEAWKATGRSPAGRGQRANEALEVITRLWAEEKVSFVGESIRVEDATISPRPVQQPLPLWIGGSSRAAILRTVKYGTGWLAGLQDVDGAIATAAEIRAEADAQSRPIPHDHYGATVLYRIETAEEAARKSESAEAPLRTASRLVVSGPAEALVEHFAAYARGGITKFVAIPVARDQRDVFEQTRRLAELVIPEAMRLPAAEPGSARGGA